METDKEYGNEKRESYLKRVLTKTFLYSCLAFFLFFLIIITYLAFALRNTISVIKNDPLIGKEVSFDSAGIYISNCPNCINSTDPKDQEYIKCLAPNLLFPGADNHYEWPEKDKLNIIYFPPQTKFIIQGSYVEHNFSIGDIKFLHMKDKNGINLYAFPENITSRDLCHKEESLDLRDLLEYAEERGSAHIKVSLRPIGFRNNQNPSGIDAVVERFKSEIPVNRSPGEYDYSILKVEDDPDNQEIVNVEMNVNLKTLVYLIYFRSDLNIWELVKV